MKQIQLIPVIHIRELPPEVIGELWSKLEDDKNALISVDWQDDDNYYLFKDWFKRAYGIVQIHHRYNTILIES